MHNEDIDHDLETTDHVEFESALKGMRLDAQPLNHDELMYRLGQQSSRVPQRNSAWTGIAMSFVMLIVGSGIGYLASNVSTEKDSLSLASPRDAETTASSSLVNESEDERSVDEDLAPSSFEFGTAELDPKDASSSSVVTRTWPAFLDERRQETPLFSNSIGSLVNSGQTVLQAGEARRLLNQSGL